MMMTGMTIILAYPGITETILYEHHGSHYDACY